MLELLRRRNFALLWFGGLISFIGDWILFVGLPVYIYQLTDSVLATGIMFVVGRLPSIAFGSVAGVFVDRWDRRRTMVVTNLLVVPLLMPLLLVDSADNVWIVYLVSLATNTVRQFMVPAENALLPKLVGTDELVTANALNTLNNNLARLIGPAIGGVVLAVFYFPDTVLLDAASFVIAGGLIALISAPPSVTRADPAEAVGDGEKGGLRREWVEGMKVVRNNRVVAALFALLGVNMIAEGILSVLMVIYVQAILGGGPMEVGWLLTAQAVGGLVGSLFVGRWSRSIKAWQMVWVGFVLLGVIDLATFNSGVLWVALVLMAIVGVPVTLLQTGVMTLFQTSVEDRFRGRVMGAFGTVSALLIMLSMAFTSVFGEQIGIVPMLSIAAILDIVAGVVAWKLLRGSETVEQEVSTQASVA
ncbi:MAG: MFS transporter [Chloroflexia bacterium]